MAMHMYRIFNAMICFWNITMKHIETKLNEVKFKSDPATDVCMHEATLGINGFVLWNILFFHSSHQQ